MLQANSYLTLVRALRKGHVTWPAIASFPVRRRLTRTNAVRLTSGLRLFSADRDPLLHLFQETFVEERYAVPGHVLPPRPTIVDIGAHIGVFTLWAAGRWRGARVIAVEPLPATCRWLQRNVTANAVPNVQIVEAACTGLNGQTRL